MRRLKLAILKNENPGDYMLWVGACEERSSLVDWEIIELTASDWLERVKTGGFDGLLAQPGGLQASLKTLYDERVRILCEELGFPVFPELHEIMIYENKRYLSYWLEANGIPHPSTRIFYYYGEAMHFAETCSLPVVGKLNIGAGGRGVKILGSREAVRKYIFRAFRGSGLLPSASPRWGKEGIVKRSLSVLTNWAAIREKFRKYRDLKSAVQQGFVLFQEYIPHTYEWRCVRIGESFFAHKKMVVGEMASGSLIKQYDQPPVALLDLIKEITDRHHMFSQAIDIFEYPEGSYLVNEMQCIFGQSDPYQMLIDGRPGRYRFVDGKWIFEEGDFNRHESFLLRLDYFIASLQQASRIKMPVP